MSAAMSPVSLNQISPALHSPPLAKHAALSAQLAHVASQLAGSNLQTSAPRAMGSGLTGSAARLVQETMRRLQRDRSRIFIEVSSGGPTMNSER